MITHVEKLRDGKCCEKYGMLCCNLGFSALYLHPLLAPLSRVGGRYELLCVRKYVE